MSKKSSKYSTMKVFGLPHIHENTSIKFTDKGLVLSVGLNVEPHIARLLTFNRDISGFKGAVVKGSCMQVYKHVKNIPAVCINTNTIQNAQAVLLEQVQIDINTAKSLHHSAIANNLRNKHKLRQ